MHTKDYDATTISVGYINVMWYQKCELYYWIKVKQLYLSIHHKQPKIQSKSEYKSDICGYVIVVYVLTVYLKNVFMCRYLSLLFIFNNLEHYNLFSLSKDFLQCHKSPANFLLIFIWFNSRKFFAVFQKSN